MRIVRRTRCRSKRGWSKACSAPSAAGRRAHGSVSLAKARHTPPATDDVSLAPHVAALTPSAGELRARSPGATRRRSPARAKLLGRDVACVRRGAVSRQSRDPSGAPGGRPPAADPPADGRVLGWMGDDPSEPVFWHAPSRNRPRSRRSAPAPKTIRRSNSGTATRALIRMALGKGPRGNRRAEESLRPRRASLRPGTRSPDSQIPERARVRIGETTAPFGAEHAVAPNACSRGTPPQARHTLADRRISTPLQTTGGIAVASAVACIQRP